MDRAEPVPAASLMGLVIAATVAALGWVILWRTRKLNTAALQLAGAALLAGLAGYAFQGRTGLTGSPAAERPHVALPEAMTIPLAEEFFGRFNGAFSWLVIANSFLARDDSGEAVATLASATRAAPRNAQLWIAYANAMRIHSGGRISPASRLAFERGAMLAPGHPGPAFFYGLAVLQTGDPEGALAIWNDLLAKAPENARWRGALATRVLLLEQLQARIAEASNVIKSRADPGDRPATIKGKPES